jgi:neutral ceramidase
MEKLYAGAAREIITPPVGAFLYGYRPDVVSTSVNDDLTVTVIALKYGGVSAALISATVCLIETEIADRIRREVGEAAGIPAENVILSSTHTHSGPRTAGSTGWGDIDMPYCDSIFIPNTVKAAKKAFASLIPSVFGVSSGSSRVGINRRQTSVDGNVSLGQNPWGQYDPRMTVISFKGKDGTPIANMVHYGAHCTAAGMNYEISRDWAGIMVDTLDRESGAPTAFFNGAEGDVGPRLSNGRTTGDLRYVNEIGQVAARDAVQLFRQIKDYRSAPLSAAAGTLKLPYGPIMPPEQAKREYAAFGGKVPPHNAELMRYRTLEGIIEAHESGREAPEALLLPQTVLALGPIAIVPFAFEFFSEISLRMREHSPFAHTLCFGCTNGSNGYLPSEDQLCRGGYEVLVFRLGHVYCLADNTDTNIIKENLRLMSGLEK